MKIEIDSIKETKDVLKKDAFQIGDIIKFTYPIIDGNSTTEYGIITMISEDSINILKAAHNYTKGYNEKTLSLDLLVTCTEIEILNRPQEEE